MEITSRVGERGNKRIREESEEGKNDRSAISLRNSNNNNDKKDVLANDKGNNTPGDTYSHQPKNNNNYNNNNNNNNNNKNDNDNYNYYNNNNSNNNINGSDNSNSNIFPRQATGSTTVPNFSHLSWDIMNIILGLLFPVYPPHYYPTLSLVCKEWKRFIDQKWKEVTENHHVPYFVDSFLPSLLYFLFFLRSHLSIYRTLNCLAYSSNS